ncbi:MAG: iron-sulfur cluster assembly scaffold protein, partial [Candidatus Cryosericum sp.]
MDKYSRATIREFMSPSNIGHIDEPSGVGHITDNADAVELTFFIKVDGEVIADAKYRIAGCTALIATLSVLSKELPGKTVEQALAIDMRHLSEVL